MGVLEVWDIAASQQLRFTMEGESHQGVFLITYRDLSVRALVDKVVGET